MTNDRIKVELKREKGTGRERKKREISNGKLLLSRIRREWRGIG
jgi:hypothetical protein